MINMKKENVVIIGAGLVGTLLSLFLVKRGYKVSIYERRSDMRLAEMAAGRSINLALSDRGIRALNEVGIMDEIRQIAIPMPGRLIHNLDGSTVFQPYGKEGQAINSVSRGELNSKLMDLAEQQGIEIFFYKKCTDIDWKDNSLLFENENDDDKETVSFDLLFGADGAFAASRLQHMLGHEKFDYNQHYIDCGYKELTIPAGIDSEFLMEKNALHIWPRKEYMLIALPNIDGSFTCTLFFPFEGDMSFEKLDSPEKVIQFFEKEFPETISLIPDLEEQFFKNPTSSLVTVKCYPWIREDKFTLIGDAAHALVPFYGQGMNCGFEDCVVLDNLIDELDHDWNNILEKFQELRKPDADAIADMAIGNFIEMRSKTADPKFLLQKKIESRMQEKYPELWIPSYAQVTFRPEIRYSEALKNSRRQEAIMEEMMNRPDIENICESEEILEMIFSKIQES
jgi:kynurenine 3-monooxygenase